MSPALFLFYKKYTYTLPSHSDELRSVYYLLYYLFPAIIVVETGISGIFLCALTKHLA